MKLSLSAKILICSIACLLLGSLSGIATGEAVNGWYSQIIKPSWNPPGWIFGPVWSLLYLMMGAAFALVWHEREKSRKAALLLFLLQFVFNLLWSVLFFGIGRMDLALIEILVLWGLILLCIFSFYKVNKTAAYLLLPYLVWVSFASVLNATIVNLNT
jgi:translocator protein